MNAIRLRPRVKHAAQAREIQGLLEMPIHETASSPSKAPATASTSRPRPRSPRPAEPRPLPYRAVLASWPDAWRERWGRLANALEDEGLSWRDAEGRAFLEIWNQWRTTAEVVERN